METKPAKSNDLYQLSSSLQRHKKQRFWQIMAPILLGGLVTLAAAVLMVLALTGTVGGISLSQYADTSLVWLILPVLVLGVFFGTLVLGMFGRVYRIYRVDRGGAHHEACPAVDVLGSHFSYAPLLILVQIGEFTGSAAN